MHEHQWIPLTIEPCHPVSINTGTIYMSQITSLRVTEIICAECKETMQIAKSPAEEAQEAIDTYRREQAERGV